MHVYKQGYRGKGHLEEVGEGELLVVGRLGDGGPHLAQILLPGLD
jgi:hypothetical protein